MPFKKKADTIIDPIVEDEVVDPTAWILNNEFANFVLMNTNEIVSLRKNDAAESMCCKTMTRKHCGRTVLFPLKLSMNLGASVFGDWSVRFFVYEKCACQRWLLGHELIE